MYRVSFFGHREIYRKDFENTLEETVFMIVRKHRFTEFYIGRNGDFDRSAASAVKRVQNRCGKEFCELVLVLPYKSRNDDLYERYYDGILYPLPHGIHYKSAITARNRWMIDHSDLALCFVERSSGGAYAALEYAKRQRIDFINLAYYECPDIP